MSPVYHQERGKGHPLILIHGFCETHEIWDGMADKLSDAFRILLPDLPGFGKSPLPPVPFTIRDIGLAMLGWLDDSEEKKENRNKVIEFVSRNGVQPFIDTFVPGLFHQKGNSHVNEVHQIASGTQSETLIAYTTAMRDRPEQLALLETFPKPILVIAGEHDASIPYEQSSAQSSLMKFPLFYGLKDAGHMGMFENEPKSIKIVKDFTNFALGFGS